MNQSTTTWTHVPQLDAVRASAILIVMISHAGLTIVPGGFGVTLFFFLSGYLITSLLRLEARDTGRVDLKRFYLRRTVRIIPSMILAISLAVFLQLAGLLPNGLSAKGLISDLTFLTNYAPSAGIRSAVPIPLWSLDVEEHFYIGFSTIFALWLGRRSPRMAAAFCAAICLVVLGMRCAHMTLGIGADRVYYWSHTRVDSILFGCILALWNNPLVDRPAYRPGPVALILALGLLAVTFLVRDEFFRETVRYTIQGAALFVVFGWVLQLDSRWSRLLSIWPIQWLALLSYTLYLVHFPLLEMSRHLGLWPAWLWGYALATLWAFLSYKLVEKPMLKWRKQIESQAKELAALPVTSA